MRPAAESAHHPPRSGRDATRPLVRLLLANLAASVVIAALTALFHDAILVAQLTATPAPDAATRDALSTTLWTRPIPVLAVAVVYPLLIRRLRAGRRPAWRRLVIIGCLQLAGLAWLTLGEHYPPWLRVLEAAQAVVVVAILVTANRPGVRAHVGKEPISRGQWQGWASAGTLVVVAPLVAELAWGSTRLSLIYVLPLYWPAYGAGALLIREVARRTGRGWASILALGVAYGLIEEGLSLQSLTSPTLFPAMAGLGPRLAGVNTTYTVMVLTYHAVFSIALPILLAELLFPDQRRTPWLGRPGLAISGVVAVIGFGLIRLIPLGADPGYLLPPAAAVVIGVLVITLVVLAVRVLPARAATVPTPTRAVDPPWIPALTAGTLTLVVLGATMPMIGARHAAWTPTTTWAWVPTLLVVALLAVAAVLGPRLAARWSDPRSTAAAITGALVAHTIVGGLSLVHTLLDRAGLAVFGVVEIALVILLSRHLRDRTTTTASAAAPQASRSRLAD